MKVRVTVRFRGREITYPEIALEDLREIAQSLADVAIVEQAPAIEGRAMSMMLVPAKGVKKKKGRLRRGPLKRMKVERPYRQRSKCLRNL